jgi:hypothetical protein
MNRCGSSSTAEQSLFPAIDGGATPTLPLHFVIRPIGHLTAKNWVERWHYSGRIPTGKNINYGLYAGPELYAIIIYGIGVNPYQAAFLGVSSVVEIKRMCRREPRLDYPLSRLIRLTMKMMRQQMPFDAVVAFADPEHGHEGTVYKAAGFEYRGVTNAEFHLEDKDGNRRHRRYAFRHARRNGIPIGDSRAVLGLARIRTAPKHRWVAMVRPRPR